MASRAGISHWWHRAIVVGIVAPCATIGVLFTVVLALIIITNGIGYLSGSGVRPELPMLGMFCLALALVGVCGLLTRWLAAKYPPGEPAGQSDAEPPPATRSTSVEE